MKVVRGWYARFYGWTCMLAMLGLGAMGIQAQITNNPASDIADAVTSGVGIFNSIYSIVIASVVLGLLLWVLTAARRRR